MTVTTEFVKKIIKNLNILNFVLLYQGSLISLYASTWAMKEKAQSLTNTAIESQPPDFKWLYRHVCSQSSELCLKKGCETAEELRQLYK